MWAIQAIPAYQFNMYGTNNHQNEYCLSYYVRDKYHYYFSGDDDVFLSTHQIMPYCFRPADWNNSIIDVDIKDANDTSFTFAELKQLNITSHILLSWSASVDLAERYQMFLSNESYSLVEKDTLYYNCTSLWFGPFCRFTFDYKMDKSFDDLVDSVFRSKLQIKTGAKLTCYKHLNCQTLLRCLDWREICDGKSDCLDGSDENYCWQLEANECTDNEYQCHNGQCIPIEFFRDAPDRADCMDRTDERLGVSSLEKCFQSPAFRCEEHTCRPGNNIFPCGDGQCTNGIFRCFNGRTGILPDDFCFNTTFCLPQLSDQVNVKWCDKYCSKTNCTKGTCSIVYDFRYTSILYGHVLFVYSKEKFESGRFTLPDYVCYDEKLCGDFIPVTKYFGNLTCCHINDLGLKNPHSYYEVNMLIENVKDIFRVCLIVTKDTFYCNYSTMHRCKNSSKCISKQRLLDGFQDCPFNDDETFNQSCSLTDARQRFKCPDDDNEKCYAAVVIQDGKRNCKNGEEDSNKRRRLIQKHIYFQTICDGKTELSPLLIDEKNETDETKCNDWPCNNTYTRCDGFWLCKDGADEVNCSPSTCPELHHSCVFPNDTSKVLCLPINQAGDGIDDCLGATDERRNYHVEHYIDSAKYDFQCWNDTDSIDVRQLCNEVPDCSFNDDEMFCTGFGSTFFPFCAFSENPLTDVEKFLCGLGNYIHRPQVIYFKLRNLPTYPLQLTTINASAALSTETNTRSIEKDSMVYISPDSAWLCNRGVPFRLRINGNTSELSCLCPPSYYGDKCQYQNQRVSLTLQIRVTSEWRSVFIFLITLFDCDRNIESHDHIEYLPIRDCASKFNVYLLYSTRPKNSLKNYSVQIDAFNQLTLQYRGSWIFPLRFPFLPVHRLPVLLRVPASDIEPIQKCWPPCIHGECFYYINDRISTFCRCEPSWSGVQCNVKHACECALGSLCISNSVCLCPRYRFGPRCHLFQLSCHSKSCKNDGQCVPLDARLTAHLNESMCICLEEYKGDRCQYRRRQNQIEILFHHKLSIPSFLMIHFISVQKDSEHNRTSIMKKIAFDQYSLSLYTSISFNIAIAQIFSHYYLIILQEQTIVSIHSVTEIIPSHRCRSINELFNQTFVNRHLLKRIKYYHDICKQQLELVCFHDDDHFCLCTLDRQTNCFEFDYNMTSNCGEYNVCENEGYCFQDDPKCPTPPLCACRQCYFGSRCQFSTKGSALSLDIILGYHIRPKNRISQQPIIVKVSISLSITMFILGFINSFFSFQTFRGKVTRNVGCGLYLFASSVISMITVIILIVKVSFLLATQIGSINSRLFLYIQCVSVDFLLRFLLSTSDWLSACVAMERTVNVLQAVKFDKARSKQVAKWMISIVLLFTSCVYIYDPIYRRLIDDEEEQRTWCVSKYSPSMQIVDWIVNILHFSLPLSINFISAPIIMITVARTRSNSQREKSFIEHLREQIRHHKHLLISPCILVILALPRLIISFLSGCMASARHSWFYLIGYFISFIPSMMTFVVFVLPSEIYKKEFSETMKRIWQR